MNKTARRVLVSTAVASLVAAALAQPATAASVVDDGATSSPAASARPDDRPGPLSKQRNALRKAALDQLAKGQATADAKGVVKLGKKKFVDTTTSGTDKIFTVLAEFGTQSDSKLGTAPGPLHNAIPAPDRSKDNSTAWTADFNAAHYEQMLNGRGESMRTFYEALSNGAYSVQNTISGWVQVPYNESYYGDNAREDVGGSWDFIEDTGNAWYASQLKAGKTAADIDAYLSQFDVWDRNDFDGDGNFDEPDGYIDHFQAVHAGMGEDAGGGAQGADAIWSHRWYVNGTDYGLTGPATNKAGGAQIGQSKYWLGDYTTEAENGGLGVFAHEFGHDLGLPDFYDTAGGENSTAFWTLMSSGSWLGHGGASEGIGTVPGLMGPQEKLFLGWLDSARVARGSSGSFTLNPAQFHVNNKEQAVRVDLPDKTTSTTYTSVPSGAKAWWTGSADNLNETLTRSIPAASKVSASADAWYQIESGYDYLYPEYSTDGGASWLSAGSPVSGSSRGRWTTLRWSYAPAGKASLFRLRYATDGGVHEPGAFVDGITLTGAPADAAAWKPTGSWQPSDGTVTATTSQYYLVENRAYAGYDDTLRTGPYQFSEAYSRPDWVEHFNFEDGMLVWYVDNAYEDNNVSAHPGHGAAMVVDARAAAFRYDDGSQPSNRRQPFDATFGLHPIAEQCLHKEVVVGTGANATVQSKAACAPASKAKPTFADTGANAYYDASNAQNSVQLAGEGATVTVTGTSGQDLLVSVKNPA